MKYIEDKDSWYYILRYNPDTRRMANAKGEIRIGASHQVILFFFFFKKYYFSCWNACACIMWSDTPEIVISFPQLTTALHNWNAYSDFIVV